MATTAALLEHLAKFPQGLTFTKIQRFIVESNGLNYDERSVTNPWEVQQYGAKPKYRRRYRGYWCDALLRNWYAGRVGFFEQYCDKVASRYVLKAKQ